MQNSSGLYIQGIGRYLPKRVELSEALVGYPDEEISRALASGLTHVTMERELYPAAMAVHAAREALERARVAPGDLAVIAVSSIHRHGHRNLWSMASYLQHTFGASAALPFNLQQGCNGNLIALQLAAAHLQNNGPAARALIVASDRFGTSAFDRFKSDYGVLYGDAATALVLGKAPAQLRICGLVTESIPEAESMHRDLTEAYAQSDSHYDARETKRRYLNDHGGMERFSRLCREALLRLKRQLLVAGTEEQLDHIIFPNLSREVLMGNYYPVFQDAERKSLWALGKTLGHLGTGDAAAGLYELCVAREIPAGRRILVIGAGAGFTLSGLLVESHAT